MCHNEVACVTAGIAMYSVILTEADAISTGGCFSWVDPATELAERLPLMLAQLSPEARALIREHNEHCVELVAGLHAALRA